MDVVNSSKQTAKYQCNVIRISSVS